MVDETPNPSTGVWEQDTSIGGEDIHSEPARQAQAVAVQGIVTVRNVPTLAASANGYDFAANATVALLGASPQRRMVTIVSTAAGIINPDQTMADAGVGLVVPANTPIVIGSACQIYWRSETTGTVSFWAELDRG